jgi:HTH-type transcriptional regulator / antitoxin HipB
MKSLRNHLQEELQNSDFKKAFDEELRLAQLAVQIAKSREKKGLTQAQLASRARITQQQVSKVEHAGASGFNVNTLIRVCEALGLDLTLSPRKSVFSSRTVGKSAVSNSSKKAVKHFTSKKITSSAYQVNKGSSKRAIVASTRRAASKGRHVAV